MLKTRKPTMTKSPRLPVTVRLDDVRELLPDARPGKVVLGLAEKAPELLDLDESHVLVIGYAGYGKTVLVRSMLAQTLAHGGYGVVLDAAHTTHEWATTHPDVSYARSVVGIHSELLRLRDELEARMAILRAGGPAPVDRVMVAIEERTALVELLKRWWAINRGANDPVRSPALDALETLEQASPSWRIHLVATVQHAAGMSSPAAREVYGTRLVGTHLSEKAYRAALGSVEPPAGRSRLRGRFWLVRHAQSAEIDVTPVQTLALTPSQARDLVNEVLKASRKNYAARIPGRRVFVGRGMA